MRAEWCREVRVQRRVVHAMQSGACRQWEETIVEVPSKESNPAKVPRRALWMAQHRAREVEPDEMARATAALAQARQNT